MKRVVDPLSLMGAQFRMEGEGTPKRMVHVKGGALKGIHYQSPVASAQVKSAILLAGLWASGETSVTEPELSRDHSERILEASGVSLKRSGTTVSIHPPKCLKVSSPWSVPGDFSSSAFFLVAGSIVPSSQVILQGVGLNPTRTGALEILQKMGARISVKELHQQGGEEVGDLEVGSASLTGTTIGGAIIPRLIDEIPILAVAGAHAKGKTHIKDAAELKVKESDRIKTLCHLLGKIGIPTLERPDGLIVEGGHPFTPAEVGSDGDHRMAMSMAVAALVAQGPIKIEDVECVNTSFPGFWGCLGRLGVVWKGEK